LYIASNPQGNVYRALIECAFQACDEFLLVARPDLPLSEKSIVLLERLSPFLIEKKDQFEWPGTKLGRGEGEIPVSVYYYRTDKEAQKILSEVSDTLHSWQFPDLPEDLCFLKDHKSWLSNSAHEQQSYLTIEDEGDIDKICSIENLELEGKTSLSGLPMIFD